MSSPELQKMKEKVDSGCLPVVVVCGVLFLLQEKCWWWKKDQRKWIKDDLACCGVDS